VRSLTEQRAFDKKVLEFLVGQPPQTVCNVARGINESAEDSRASLHRLADSGMVLMVGREGGPELFRLNAGGYSPEPEAA
tara:strand:+ start:780 stop:1019 length:240 start_codon:yes stop_codon:yes gene_type:complete